MVDQILTKALEMASEFAYAGPLVVQAIQLLKKLRKVKAALEKALRPPFNHSECRRTVEKCEQIGYIQDHTPYGDVVRLSGALDRTHEVLHAAKDSWDEEQIERAIAEADKPQFHGHAWDCKLADDCRYQLKKVIFLKGECALAIQECIEQQVSPVAANRLTRRCPIPLYYPKQPCKRGTTTQMARIISFRRTSSPVTHCSILPQTAM